MGTLFMKNIRRKAITLTMIVLSKIYFTVFCWNGNFYYDRYFANCRKVDLFIKNILRMGRIKIYLKYKLFCPRREKRNLISDENKKDVEKLKKDGYLKIEKFVSPDICDKLILLAENEGRDVKYINEQDAGVTTYRYLPIDNNLAGIWVNKKIVELASGYFGRTVYAAMYPHYHSITSKSDSLPTKISTADSQINSSWHYDNPLYLACFILLSDVDVNDSHTQYLEGTNRCRNINLYQRDLYMSDENVKATKRKVAHLTGKKGDLVIFDESGFHRLWNSKGSSRKAIKFEISCGNDINMNYEDIYNCLSIGFKLDDLDSKSLSYLSGLFPQKIKRGYSYTRREYKTMKEDIYF